MVTDFWGIATRRVAFLENVSRLLRIVLAALEEFFNDEAIPFDSGFLCYDMGAFFNGCFLQQKK
jgi:hypothetical protein